MHAVLVAQFSFSVERRTRLQRLLSQIVVEASLRSLPTGYLSQDLRPNAKVGTDSAFTPLWEARANTMVTLSMSRILRDRERGSRCCCLTMSEGSETSGRGQRAQDLK